MYDEQDSSGQRMTVSMPFRAFGDSDLRLGRVATLFPVGFQCPFGHSGILTSAQ